MVKDPNGRGGSEEKSKKIQFKYFLFYFPVTVDIKLAYMSLSPWQLQEIEG